MMEYNFIFFVTINCCEMREFSLFFSKLILHLQPKIEGKLKFFICNPISDMITELK